MLMSLISSDFQPGEIKYNREVEMDLSYVPWIMPSLGLVAGRNRRDASNRSLVKRRPPSLRQKAESSEVNGGELKKKKKEVTSRATYRAIHNTRWLDIFCKVIRPHISFSSTTHINIFNYICCVTTVMDCLQLFLSPMQYTSFLYQTATYLFAYPENSDFK